MIIRIVGNTAVLLAVCCLAVWTLDRIQKSPEGVAAGGVQAVGAPSARPGQAQLADTGDGYELVIPAGGNGHYFVDGAVNGVQLQFLVDTGASTVVLSEADAQRAGVNIYTLDYDRAFQTANGVIHTASVTLDRVSIADLELEDVSATISRAPMSISLLGMSFLSRLNGYEVRNDDLILHW